jgi:hypothetical protein
MEAGQREHASLLPQGVIGHNPLPRYRSSLMIATILLVCILLAVAAAAYFPGNGR